MTKNLQLVRPSEVGRFWRLGFDELSPAERVFRAVWELEGDVNNGGFEQYSFNSSGDTVFAVVDALTAIGASEAARIVAEANGMFPGSSPPRDRRERWVLLDGLGPEQKAVLDKLDEEFLRYPDDLTTLLHEYVRRNSDQVSGATEVGM